MWLHPSSNGLLPSPGQTVHVAGAHVVAYHSRSPPHKNVRTPDPSTSRSDTGPGGRHRRQPTRKRKSLPSRDRHQLLPCRVTCTLPLPMSLGDRYRRRRPYHYRGKTRSQHRFRTLFVPPIRTWQRPHRRRSPRGCPTHLMRFTPHFAPDRSPPSPCAESTVSRHQPQNRQYLLHVSPESWQGSPPSP